MAAKINSTASKSNISTEAVEPCICGALPELRDKLGAQTLHKYIVYGCPNCKREAMIWWLPTQGAIAIGTWNGYIKEIREYKGL